jgi:hypothetical protein
MAEPGLLPRLAQCVAELEAGVPLLAQVRRAARAAAAAAACVRARVGAPFASQLFRVCWLRLAVRRAAARAALLAHCCGGH